MSKKKEVRAAFRKAVFERSKYRCQGPGCKVQTTPETAEKVLDAHHIQDRSIFKNGGYTSQNGIALCSECHLKAEQFHATGKAYPGFAPQDLYNIIGSSAEKAQQADKN